MLSVHTSIYDIPKTYSNHSNYHLSTLMLQFIEKKLTSFSHYSEKLIRAQHQYFINRLIIKLKKEKRSIYAYFIISLLFTPS